MADQLLITIAAGACAVAMAMLVMMARKDKEKKPNLIFPPRHYETIEERQANCQHEMTIRPVTSGKLIIGHMTICSKCGYYREHRLAGWEEGGRCWDRIAEGQKSDAKIKAKGDTDPS